VPGFSISASRICVNSPITITESSNVASTGYNFNYNGTTPIENVALVPKPANNQYTYTQPGSYTILQAGSASIGFTSCRFIEVLPLDPVKIATVKPCSGGQVQVTLDPATLGQYDFYTVRWGDGRVETKTRAQVSSTFSYTYAGGTTGTTYTISITGSYGNGNGAIEGCTSPTFSALPFSFTASTGQPTITRLTTTSDNSISIQYNTGGATSVELYQRDASGMYNTTGQGGTGTTPFIVSTDARQVQCFQVVAKDACSATPINSDDVCSLVLTAKANSKENDLSWQPYAGTVTPGKPFRTYRVFRNGTPTGGTITDQSRSSYADANNIQCGVQYCYSLVADVGPAEITSGPICVTGVSGEVPDAPGNTLVSIENNRPRLVTTLPLTGTATSYTLAISRSTSPTGSFAQVNQQFNNNTFVDQDANPNTNSYCYQVTYQNTCGQVSPPSQPACTVYLSSNSSSGIDWTSASPFSNAPSAGYTVEILDDLNGTTRVIQVDSDTDYRPDPNEQSQKYRIVATSNTGVFSYSNYFTLRRSSRILVPDAFTPDGDGMNDTFVPKGIFVERFQMTIFDRWGNVIYSTTDRTLGWDGTINGTMAQDGKYAYYIETQDQTGEKTVRSGSVLLIRRQ
jgi:gliding motility-associated-like protein